MSRPVALLRFSALLCFFLSIHLPAHASVPELETLQQHIKFAEAQQLWNETEWLNLVHYQPHSTQSGFLSQVDDPRFFFAENGKVSPRDELYDTLRALYDNVGDNPDEHAQCRFIARKHWLASVLPGKLSDIPTVSCAAYTKWREHVPEHKVSLIFPAYHLNSPSSMFGHTLLRIDPPDEQQGSTLLSMAVNFGANIDSSDNSMLFAVKGLFGGYFGNFIVTPYYKKIKEYNRHENRDIWEYPLNLTPQETLRIVEHLWELKDINFDYYFFDENCSYRLLELLEVARPGLELKNQFGLTAIPVDTVRSIDQAGLINGIDYRPSQTTNIHFLLRQLDASQRDLVYRLSMDAELIDSTEFQQLDSPTQMQVIDAAYRYLRYRQNEEGRSEDNASNSFKLLQHINQMDNFVSHTAGYSEEQRPERGHLSKRFSLAAGEDTDQAYVELRLRMSFHSLEDNINGFLEGAQINMGSFSLRATEDEVQLQHLDVIDIFSLTPRNDFFQPLSWKIYTGLEQQLVDGEDHLAAHVTGGAGVTYALWDHGYAYGLIMARLESNSRFDDAIAPAIGFSGGLLHHFSFGTSHLNISGEEFDNNEHRQRIDFKQNFPFSRNHALSFRYIRQRQPGILFSEAELAYQYFFH